MLNGKNHQVITSVSKQCLLRVFTEGPKNELSEKDQFYLQSALVVPGLDSLKLQLSNIFSFT